MPALLERLVSQLQAKGKNKQEAYAIATKQLQKAGDLKPGSQELTRQGAHRQDIGAAGRAKERAARYASRYHKASEYTYSSKTNRARLK